MKLPLGPTFSSELQFDLFFLSPPCEAGALSLSAACTTPTLAAGDSQSAKSAAAHFSQLQQDCQPHWLCCHFWVGASKSIGSKWSEPTAITRTERVGLDGCEGPGSALNTAGSRQGRTKCSCSTLLAWQLPFEGGLGFLIGGNFQEHLQQYLDLFHLHPTTGWP